MKSPYLFLIIGFLFTSAIILPLNAVDTNPLVSINAFYNTSLLPQQIRITKYPSDNCSFKNETSQGLVIITDPCDMNEEVQPDIVMVSHRHDDHDEFRFTEPSIKNRHRARLLISPSGCKPSW